jgi:hypothetical protein
VWVFAPTDSREPAPRIESVTCRDVDVSVKRETFTPGE